MSAALLLLASASALVPSTARLGGIVSLRPLRASRQSVAFEPALTGGTVLQSIPTLIADDDIFGEVFLAGMAIALATVGTTIFAGILVRGRYDDIEQSIFDREDDDVQQSDQRAGDEAVGSDVIDFFGDVNPQMNSGESSSKEPADTS